VDQALNILNFTQKKLESSRRWLSPPSPTLNNDGADIDDLKVKTIYVEQGATLRFPRAPKAAAATASTSLRAMYVVVGN
jgi:large subunit ribosomal protein L22